MDFLVPWTQEDVSSLHSPEIRRDRPPMALWELAQLASDKTGDLTKIRWQFSVLVRSGTGRRTEKWWHRIVKSIRNKSSRGTHGGWFS